MKSILQENKKQCYICKKIYGIDREQIVEEHHVFPGNNRKNSEKYGLKVWLCPNHHQFGPDAVHKMPNEGYDLLLKQIGQARFRQTYRDLNFVEIFGKNYLEVGVGPEQHT